MKSSEPWTRTAWRCTARNEDTHFFHVKSHNHTEPSRSCYKGYSVSLVILDLSLSSATDELDCTWYQGVDKFSHALFPTKHWVHFWNTINYFHSLWFEVFSSSSKSKLTETFLSVSQAFKKICWDKDWRLLKEVFSDSRVRDNWFADFLILFRGFHILLITEQISHFLRH